MIQVAIKNSSTNEIPTYASAQAAGMDLQTLCLICLAAGQDLQTLCSICTAAGLDLQTLRASKTNAAGVVVALGGG